jgi:hypothetical protein
MMFLPRRARVVCFWIVTPLQIGIILTANYTFLNYLVLALGVLLLDDIYLAPLKRRLAPGEPHPAAPAATPAWWRRAGASVANFLLLWDLYAATALLIFTLTPRLPLATAPIRALEPFRIANQYGLFGVMTTARYEIEFQGSDDGQTWLAYPFRYKPQNVYERPRIYAPYQPRLDWNLWFASLASWRSSPFVVYTEEALLENNASVLHLFRANPFAPHPPRYVRSVVWRYWFTNMAALRREHRWWNREYLGLYAPELERISPGKYAVVQWPRGEPANE